MQHTYTHTHTDKHTHTYSQAHLPVSIVQCVWISYNMPQLCSLFVCVCVCVWHIVQLKVCSTPVGCGDSNLRLRPLPSLIIPHLFSFHFPKARSSLIFCLQSFAVISPRLSPLLGPVHKAVEPTGSLSLSLSTGCSRPWARSYRQEGLVLMWNTRQTIPSLLFILVPLISSFFYLPLITSLTS